MSYCRYDTNHKARYTKVWLLPNIYQSTRIWDSLLLVQVCSPVRIMCSPAAMPVSIKIIILIQKESAESGPSQRQRILFGTQDFSPVFNLQKKTALLLILLKYLIPVAHYAINTFSATRVWYLHLKLLCSDPIPDLNLTSHIRQLYHSYLSAQREIIRRFFVFLFS